MTPPTYSIEPSCGPYYIGDLVTVTATFIDQASGEPTNPTDILFTVRDGLGNITTNSSPTNPDVGVFTAQLDITCSGIWRWSAAGTGTAQARNFGSFEVEPDPFAS